MDALSAPRMGVVAGVDEAESNTATTTTTSYARLIDETFHSFILDFTVQQSDDPFGIMNC